MMKWRSADVNFVYHHSPNNKERTLFKKKKKKDMESDVSYFQNPGVNSFEFLFLGISRMLQKIVLNS